MKGRKPNLKAIEGGRQKAPAAPDYLGTVAREEWQRAAPVLAERGLLTEADVSLLASYCQAVEAARECAEVLARDGRFFTVPGNLPKQHPAVRLELAYLESVRRYAAELGITAVARHRAGGKKQEAKQDAWADLDL